MKPASHKSGSGTVPKTLHLPWLVLAVLAAAVLAAGAAHAGAPFVDNGDSTVTDTSTGLMWDQCSAGLSGAGCATGSAATYNLANALGLTATQNAANYKGYSDWRLPSVVELHPLVNADSLAIDTAAFPNTPAMFFWSASSYAFTSASAWGVYFDGLGDNVSPNNKASTNHVRLVRGGQYFGAFALLSGGAVSGVTTSTATLSATSPVAATGYWLAVPRDAMPPTPPQVIAGIDYGGVAVKAGSGAMVAKTATSFALSALVAGTAYDLYVVARESTYNTNSALIGPLQFSTLAIGTSSIVIDPATPATLYSGLDGAGVYKSTDSGANWTAATTQPANTRIKALVIQPGDSAALFAATYGGGAFKSADSGVNWSACAAQPANLNLLSLTMDAAGKLYAGSEAGVFVSSDGCASWTEINTGLPL